MDSEQIKQLIEAGIPGATAHVDGDGSHFVARVISEEFEGLSMVQQHQRVYATLGNAMEGAIHALSLQTFTPAAWERAAKFQTIG